MKLGLNNKLVENYLKQQEVLFEKWKNKENHKGALFIEDGIVNPEMFFDSQERILFLLKEAYAKEQDDLSLTKWLNDETVKITTIWRRVSEWTRFIIGCLSGMDEAVLFKRESEVGFNGNEFLRKIAVVNVKKSDGKSNSKPEDLADYVDKDKKELMEQLQLCDPTIIVCGNVEDYLREIINEVGEKLVIIDKDHYIYRFVLNGHDVLVISFWHPANRYPNMMNYYSFANVSKVAFSKK